MKSEEFLAFDLFYHSGKIQDYLNYISTKQQPESSCAVERLTIGETSAYHNRCDCIAGTGDG